MCACPCGASCPLFVVMYARVVSRWCLFVCLFPLLGIDCVRVVGFLFFLLVCCVLCLVVFGVDHSHHDIFVLACLGVVSPIRDSHL